jgi:aspartate racemase
VARPGASHVLGLVGGIGPESTIDYYRKLIAGHRCRTGDQSSPALIIDSIDLARTLALIAAGKTRELSDYLVREVHRLAAAGAELGLLASNSVHVVFEDVRKRSPIPLVSIVAAARDEARQLGLVRLGLLGTQFTMQGRFYPDVFLECDLAVVAPKPDEQQVVHEIYVDELLCGNFQETSRAAVLRIVNDMVTREGIDGVLLAGTELPLLFREGAVRPIPFLDTTDIHVRAVMERVSADA